MKSPWLTVLDHRFIDGNITNCRHIGGSFSLSGPPPEAKREVLPDGRIIYYGSFSSNPGAFQFSLDRPLSQVLGIEVQVKVRYLESQIYNSFARFIRGGNWELGVSAGNLNVIMDNKENEWFGYADSIRQLDGRWSNIKWSWRINGQSILSHNGAIVAVRPDVSPNRTSNIDLINLGINPQIPGHSIPYQISHFSIAVLTNERLKETLDRVIPIDAKETAKLNSACKNEFEQAIQAIFVLLNELLASVVSEQTKTWVKEDGGRPISKEGVRLHEFAHLSAISIARYLNGENEALGNFETQFCEFLSLLYALAKNRIPNFATRIKKMLSSIQISEKCKKAAFEIQCDHADEFKRFNYLLDTLLQSLEKCLRVDLNYKPR